MRCDTCCIADLARRDAAVVTIVLMGALRLPPRSRQRYAAPSPLPSPLLSALHRRAGKPEALRAGRAALTRVYVREQKGEIVWSRKNVLVYPLLALLAGTLGGMLGFVRASAAGVRVFRSASRV